MGKPGLRQRVITAAEEVLAEQRSVSPVEVFLRLGWIHPVNVETWRKGRVDALAEMISARPESVIDASGYLIDWAREQGLQPRQVEYLARGRERRELKVFTWTTVENERSLRTHWFAADEAPAEVAKVVERESKPPDLVVVIPIKDWTCASCQETGAFLIMENDEPLCLDCADMGHLVFLPRGDAALTRRAKKASGLSAVVIRWARARKRYERQGILVEEDALAAAEEQCLADEDARERRRERDAERRARADVTFQAALATEIRRLYPGCPAERAEAIARHAATRGSGRVGRTAAGRALDARAVTLAVVASVRHSDTDYDDLLMAGVPRARARERVAAAIDRKLDEWQSG